MASTSNSKRSSSSSSNSKWRYDVFVSFRGKDTRNNFTAHLQWALDRGNIETYRDNKELPRGKEIAPELLKAIEGSRIAIIVFSKNYANSEWCLDELLKIMECEKEKGQTVFPIFYDVDPSEVVDQTGIYGEAFKNHERNADEEKKKKIEEWKTALRKAGNLSGFPLQDRSEAEFIEEIIGEIETLIPKFLHVGKNIVGLDEKVAKVKSLIDTQSKEVSMIVIYGIGGIGKTTIAKAVYNDMLHQFKRHSFLQNVREKSKDDHGVLQLQETLLCDIRMEKDLKLNDVGEGFKRIKKCKHDLGKVLIVFDDVDSPDNLKFLARKSKWFYPGSIIIVTTRYKCWQDVQKSYKAYQAYEAKGLADDKAMELFSWNAFEQRHPKEKYVVLSNRILHYAKGLPLALVVLGSSLKGKVDEEFWESTLDKLKTIPNAIQRVLRISYDDLDDCCKALFLDIACFFKDDNEEFVKRILEGSGTHPGSGLTTLSERGLISILGGTIMMHDLLQEMGWAIVRQNNPKHPGRWSRLWKSKDIASVFRKNAVTENIEGIFLNRTAKKPIQFTTEAFRKMDCLRLLIVKSKMAKPSPDFELPNQDLTYFHWEWYPLESMPSNFHADNLVELNLQRSNIRHLWKGNMDATKLKVIDLTLSEHLVDISSISSVPNLEILILKGCKSLESLPGNLQELKCLQSLSLAGCSQIRSFLDIEQGNLGSLRELDLSETGIKELPSTIWHLCSLQYLNLSGCEDLLSLPGNLCELICLQTLTCAGCCKIRSFPDTKQGNMGRLRELDLSGTGIMELPSSIGHLCSLQQLNLSECKDLLCLPGNLHELICLETLTCAGCCKIRSFPDTMQGNMGRLRDLDLSGTGIIELPSSIGHLCSLQQLNLSECIDLLCLPGNLHELICLETLTCANCCKLRSFPDTKQGNMGRLRELDLRGTGIIELPLSIGHLCSLQQLNLSDCRDLLCLPGNLHELKCLQTLCCAGCDVIKSFPDVIQENLGRLRALYLSETGIIELPSSIGHLHGLVTLDLSSCNELVSLAGLDFGSLEALEFLNFSDCYNLESLPTGIRSLSSLRVDNCFKLLVLKVRLGFYSECSSGTCRIVKSGVIWDNCSFSSLNSINPQWVGREQDILNYICPLSSLLELFVANCWSTSRDIHPSFLQISSLRNFHLLKGGILSDIFRLSSLVALSICNCNLKGVEIPHDIRNLSSLQCLSLSNCELMEGESLNQICHLSSLKRLSLDGNHFTSLPAGISRLSNLKALNLSHCKKLQQITELPSSLEFLDAHCSDGISSSPSFLLIHSLVSSFKGKKQDGGIDVGCSSFNGHGIGIVIPRSSGILEQIRCQSMGSSEVEIRLPPNWCEDNDFLGFALYGVYASDRESEHGSAPPSVYVHRDDYDSEMEFMAQAGDLFGFSFSMYIRENNQSRGGYAFTFDSSCETEDVSDMVWVVFYPKAAAITEFNVSNEFSHSIAQFWGNFGVKECGIRLIYTKDYEQKHPTMAQGNTSHGNFCDRGSKTDDTNNKAHNKRNLTKQSSVEESHHKRFRGTLD